MRVTRVGALVLVAAVAVAGCGVEGKVDEAGPSTTTSTTAPTTTSTTGPATTTSTALSTTTTTEAPTTTTTAPGSDGAARAAFVEAANRICREGSDALAGGEPDATDQDAMAAYITGTFVPAVRRQLDEIRALGFPPGDEAELAAILDDTDAALDRLAADPIGVINSGRDPFGDVNARLNAYGLTDCGAS